jgi:hypothetical protein
MTAPIRAWLRDIADRRRVVKAPQGGLRSGRYDLRFSDGRNTPVVVQKVESSMSDGSALSDAAMRARKAQIARIKEKP